MSNSDLLVLILFLILGLLLGIVGLAVLVWRALRSDRPGLTAPRTVLEFPQHAPSPRMPSPPPPQAMLSVPTRINIPYSTPPPTSVFTGPRVNRYGELED